MSVFADTSYFIALVNPDDDAHEDAVRYTADFTGEIVTTECVLNEFANFLAKPSVVRRDAPRIARRPAHGHRLSRGGDIRCRLGALFESA